MPCNSSRALTPRQHAVADSLAPLVENPKGEAYDRERNISNKDIERISDTVAVLLSQYREGPAATNRWFASLTPNQRQRLQQDWQMLDNIRRQACQVDEQGPCSVAQVGETEGNELASLMAMLGGLGGAAILSGDDDLDGDFLSDFGDDD